MSKQNKQNSNNLTIGIHKVTEVENRQELKQMLIQLTEQKVGDKFTDKSIDRQDEIVELLNGSRIPLKEFENNWKIISQKLQEYSPRFPKEFYAEINRLNHWTKPESQLYLKPPIVGRFTNEIIYGRFTKDVLATLQQLNPYMHMGIRRHKHFQWLTLAGQEKVDEFIQDAIRVMKMCTKWYEFRVKHSREYGVTFQLSFLEENENLF